jgi:hypothetical protein
MKHPGGGPATTEVHVIVERFTDEGPPIDRTRIIGVELGNIPN